MVRRVYQEELTIFFATPYAHALAHHRINVRAIIRLTAYAFIGALLGACTGLEAESDAAANRQDALELKLDQCLELQRATTEKIENQQDTLLSQSKEVAEVKGMLARRLSSSNTASNDSEKCASSAERDDKLVVGTKEQVWLPNLGLSLPARVDTGAETASVDARNITLFERNGKRWVRFEILHPKTEEPIEVERKLERTVLIMQASSSEPERRRVVKLGITIGHVNQTAEFTLSDRSHLDYQILIGRNILQDVMVVDVSKKNIAPPVVPKPDSS